MFPDNQAHNGPDAKKEEEQPIRHHVLIDNLPPSYTGAELTHLLADTLPQPASWELRRESGDSVGANARRLALIAYHNEAAATSALDNRSASALRQAIHGCPRFLIKSYESSAATDTAWNARVRLSRLDARSAWRIKQLRSRCPSVERWPSRPRSEASSSAAAPPIEPTGNGQLNNIGEHRRANEAKEAEKARAKKKDDRPPRSTRTRPTKSKAAKPAVRSLTTTMRRLSDERSVLLIENIPSSPISPPFHPFHTFAAQWPFIERAESYQLLAGNEDEDHSPSGSYSSAEHAGNTTRDHYTEPYNTSFNHGNSSDGRRKMGMAYYARSLDAEVMRALLNGMVVGGKVLRATLLTREEAAQKQKAVCTVDENNFTPGILDERANGASGTNKKKKKKDQECGEV